MDRLFPTGDQIARGNSLSALQQFVGKKDEVAEFYSDDAGELQSAAKELGWRTSSATLARPQTNGVIERNVRRVIEGARSAFLHAGFGPKWWSRAVRHFCTANNFTRPVRDGYTAWKLRRGSDFNRHMLPCGCLVDFKPTTQRIIDGQEKFAPKSVPGLFIIYFMLPGGSGQVTTWSSN